MEKNEAIQIVHIADEASASLNQALALGQKYLSNEAFLEMRAEVGRMLVNIQLDVLRPVYLQFPDLDRYGYFRSRQAEKETPE